MKSDDASALVLGESGGAVLAMSSPEALGAASDSDLTKQIIKVIGAWQWCRQFWGGGQSAS